MFISKKKYLELLVRVEAIEETYVSYLTLQNRLLMINDAIASLRKEKKCK
jgi:hypothetical protein